jgi:hypothetical protein
MLTLTSLTVTREHVWGACRHPAEGRWRARDHAISLLMAGKRGPAVAPWLSRDGDTRRAWGHAFHEAGLRGLARAPLPGRPP